MTAQFGFAGLAAPGRPLRTQWWLAAQLPGRFEQAAARGLVLTIVVASALTSTLVDHAEGFFFAYMSGLLFAGYAGGGTHSRADRSAAQVSAAPAGARAPALAAPASVLVVVTRRRGDVLLATPLIRSLKAAWPQAGIDVLVFAGTQGVLEANPDVRRVITIAERPGLFAHLALARTLLRRYDIALSCLAGDRPTAYAVVAGRWRAGMVGSGNGARWKRRMLSKAIPFDDLDTHTAAMNLAFAEILGIARHHEIGIGWTAQDAARVAALLGERARDTPYAVLHVHPKFNYKMWHVEGWAGLAHWLGERGFDTILTGGASRAKGNS